jgi:hypothetical protein
LRSPSPARSRRTAVGQWGARRFGGSRRAQWGALIGGFAGLFVGTPIPVLGSLVMSFVGTFAGCARRRDDGARAGSRRSCASARARSSGGRRASRLKLGMAFAIAVLSLISFLGGGSS